MTFRIVLLSGLIIFTTYTHSLLRKFSKENNLYLLLRLLVNVVYSIVISVVVGIFPTLLSLVFFSNYVNSDLADSTFILFTFPVLIFSSLLLVLLLNFRNHTFSLPRVIFVFIVTLILANPIKHYKHAFGFIIASFIFMFSLSVSITIFFLVPVFQTEQSVYSIFIFCLMFSIVFSIIIYSYSAAKPIQRLYRKFVLWSILSIVIFSYTIAQIYAKLNQVFNQQSQIDMVLLIGGLIFTITTVLDKGEELLAKLSTLHSIEIKHIWKNYYKLYNVNKLLNHFVIIINDILTYWKSNKKFHVIIQYISILLFTIVVLIFVNKLVNVLSNFDLANSFKQHLNKKEQDFLSKITPLLMFLSAAGWLISRYVKRFGALSWTSRGTGICFIGLTLLIFFSMLNNIFFNQILVSEIIKFLLTIIAFGFILFGFIKIIQKVYEWLKN